MTAFEHVTALFSFVYALALTHLLARIAELIVARDRVKFSGLLALGDGQRHSSRFRKPRLPEDSECRAFLEGKSDRSTNVHSDCDRTSFSQAMGPMGSRGSAIWP